jgi:hypothetical protein
MKEPQHYFNTADLDDKTIAANRSGFVKALAQDMNYHKGKFLQNNLDKVLPDHVLDVVNEAIRKENYNRAAKYLNDYDVFIMINNHPKQEVRPGVSQTIQLCKGNPYGDFEQVTEKTIECEFTV